MIEILARTIFGEARGEYAKPEGGLASLIGVANVVMNRLQQKTWYGKTIEEVCRKPYQFSCWNARDPNFPLLQAHKIADPVFDTCLEVSAAVIKGLWPDLTKGSDHYHTVSIRPPWAISRTPKIRIGNHLFYCLKGK